MWSRTDIAAAMCDAARFSNVSKQASLIERHIKKRSPGQFILPGLMKIEVKKKPATKAREGINSFTGEETVFKAKPAHRAVKIKPLKKVKDMLG